MKTLKFIMFTFFMLYVFRMFTSCTKTNEVGKIIPKAAAIAAPIEDSITYDTTYISNGPTINDWTFPGHATVDSIVFTSTTSMHSSTPIDRWDEISFYGLVNHFDDGGLSNYSNTPILRWSINPIDYHYFEGDIAQGAFVTSAPFIPATTKLSITYYSKR